MGYGINHDKPSINWCRISSIPYHPQQLQPDAAPLPLADVCEKGRACALHHESTDVDMAI